MAKRSRTRHVPTMVSAAIFDVDGTIVDTNDLQAAAWQQAFRRLGREIPYEKVRHEIGKGADQLLPVFLTPDELRRVGPAISAARREIYARDYLPQVRPRPEVRALFQRLVRDGRRIVLASSAERSELAVCIDRAAVRGLVADAVSGDDVERSKPHPDVFETALDKLGSLEPREVVIVGDTPYDAEAAAKLGVVTIGLLCGGFPEMELVEAGCAEIYADPGDLLARYEASALAPRRQRLAS